MNDDLVEKLIKQSKLRRTPVRAGVLRVLAAASRLGAVEIRKKLPPHTDPVTVYRTLNTFTKKERDPSRARGGWRLAVCPRQSAGDDYHQHPHFVCEECGKVECLKEAEIPRDFVKSLGVGSRYSVHYPEVVLHGTCPRSASKRLGHGERRFLRERISRG